MRTYEVNFDGLVGPTHNYAGLSVGNLASKRSAAKPSNPKAAALQGLDKMMYVRSLGLHQGILAPNARPDTAMLRSLGFSGSDAQVIKSAYKANPVLVNACYSASSMWSANAATVTPSNDSADNKVHFTPANLQSLLHRFIESPHTSNILKATFADPKHFAHHDALVAHSHFADEGAANHTRLAPSHGDRGLHFFVYGRSAYTDKPAPKKFPARQTLEASQAIARLHQIPEQQCVFAQQNPDVIDQGVFHNDVIALGNEHTLFCHEQAFYQQGSVLESLKQQYRENNGQELSIVEVPTAAVSVEDAVNSYLFNSQLITLNDGSIALISPTECEQVKSVRSHIDEIIAADNPISAVHFVDVKQSMSNGGGPACLRLRVQLNEQELAAVNQKTLIDEQQYQRLQKWVNEFYREQLCEADLLDPQLLVESHQALDELTQILNLGSVYPFQQE